MTITPSSTPLSADEIRTDPLLPKGTRFGPIHIAVRAAEPALAIWRDIVGLQLIAQTDAALTLGVGDSVLVVLEVTADAPVLPHSLGLYHVAIHVPSRQDMARFVIRAAQARLRIAPTDHLVSEAIYAWDQDGNGIEITFETPERGTIAPVGAGYFGIKTDGSPHSGVEPLDVQGLVQEVADEPNPGATPMSEGTRIGHVHVHVSDLDQAMLFYRDLIGFGGQFIMHERGMGDVGLDYVPHAIAFNTWAGPNAKQPPHGHAGLRYFTMVLPDAKALAELEARLVGAGHSFTRDNDKIITADPFGNHIHIGLA